jgi:DMSO/TMAO reductase YedYZ molybdopterin-dependent catalytic subunit
MKKPEPNFVVQPTPSAHFANRGNGSEEMKWGPAAEYGETVPNDRFYIHSRASPPKVDIGTWRLELTGSGLSRPRSFTYEELLALPAVTSRRTLDCGVNCRAFFPKVSPYKSLTWLPIGWTQWHFGAVSAADWTGVRMKDVLDAAGLGRAANAKFTSLDSIAMGAGKLPYSQVISIEKILARDSLLAYRMNGEALPIDHGYPVRAVFSGWGGNTAVKWVGSIEVSADPLPLTHFQENQVLAGPDYPAPMLPTVGPVRSALELNENVTLLPGDHTLHGRAWSGAGAIDRVDVCLERLIAPDTWAPVWDPPWREAKLLNRAEPMIWVRFEVGWEGAQPGRYRLMTRATDEEGRTQPRPEDMIWNEHGVGYNGHAPLELSVLPLWEMP